MRDFLHISMALSHSHHFLPQGIRCFYDEKYFPSFSNILQSRVWCSVIFRRNYKYGGFLISGLANVRLISKVQLNFFDPSFGLKSTKSGLTPFKSRNLTKLNASQSQCMIWEGKVYVHTHKIYCTLLLYCNLLLKCLNLLLFLFRYSRIKFETSQRIGKWSAKSSAGRATVVPRWWK